MNPIAGSNPCLPRTPAALVGVGVSLIVWFTLMLGGCATGPRPAPMMPAEADRRSAASPSQPIGAAGESNAESWSKAPRTQRSGLATTFGESRDSAIQPTSFRRSDSTPRSQLTIHYNDRPGLDAMMAGLWGTAQTTNCPMWLGWGRDFQAGLRGEDGNWLPTQTQAGRTFVEGQIGERYSVVLINQAKARREVVISVDGLDAMDGEAASVRKRGYILDPGQEFAVEGFRTGPNTVATFRFGTVNASYSNQRHGAARNVGVIGIAVFEEKDRESERRSEANPFPGRWATAPGW